MVRIWHSLTLQNDPEYIFYAYKRYNYVQKDPNFVAEKDLYKDVTDKPQNHCKVQITNANYKRHGMKPMILVTMILMIMNSRKKKIITLRKWKKSVKVQKTKMRLNLVAKADNDHGGGH